jgi:hypothetical protein
MCSLDRSIAAVVYAWLIFGSLSATAGSGMTITINNDTSNDLLVTVYDLNTRSVQKILSSEKINSFASISVTINPDEAGRGHLSWSATNTDGGSRTCGHIDSIALNDSDTVQVYANSACSAALSQAD